LRIGTYPRSPAHRKARCTMSAAVFIKILQYCNYYH
jgi:hypothetical protein